MAASHRLDDVAEGAGSMRGSVILTVLGLLLGLVVAACAGNDSNAGEQAGTPAGTDRAWRIAHNMLLAYNSGDYQAFSRDWSSPVKLLVGERAFQQFRAQNLPSTGPFKAITSVTPTANRQDAGHVSYQVHATFEQQEGVVFTITLAADGAKVEGLEFNSQS
jgi:hypothetical protein